ncbi:oligosaccharide flippase family protein, partial [Algoriphagus sp. A40]|uniref:oligosaccharide flippase family protein n=1 Tax=Algoriphagus sp. A40 TaxID=1945863 RepID=UPI0014391D28
MNRVQSYFKRGFSSSLLKSSGIYTIIGFVNKSFPFILLPILSRELSLNDFGQYSMYRTTLSFLTPLVGLSLSEFVIRKFFENLNANYIFTIINQVILNSIFVFLVGWYFSSLLFSILGLNEILFYAAIFVSLSSIINN